MTLPLRRAMPSDAPALTDCIIAAYAEHAASGIDLPPVADGVLMDIRDHVVWIAGRGTEVRGGVILAVEGQTAELRNLVVHPAAKGTGLGRALIDRAVQSAREAGHSIVELATHRDIPQNVALYEHLGWVVTAREGVRVRMTYRLDQG